MSKNLYEVLGLPKDATQSDIKKAYRTLSLEFHPDRNSAPDAQSKFQEISSAYETLSDQDKRKQYDMEQSGVGGIHFANMEESCDISNLFNMVFGLGGMGNGMGGIHMMHPGMNNFGPNIRIFHGGREMFHQQQKPPPIIKTVQITLEQCYSGCSMPIEIERWVYNDDIKCSELETVYLTIPQGIDENECIMVTGKGNVINEELKGDIKVQIQVINNTQFTRQGLNLFLKKTVSLKESLCGFSFELHHLNGKTFCLNNNTNHTIIKPGFNKNIPNLGMIRENTCGSLIIGFDVEYPETLTPEQIEGLKTILI
jgi:DnaJ-class molecular chaperone